MRSLRWFLFASLVLLGGPSLAEESPDLTQHYQIFSPYYSLPGHVEKKIGAINFRFAWTKQAPYAIAVQFTNSDYNEIKLKFAIKDTTKDSKVLIDTEHNAYFAVENLKAESDGTIWAGEIEDLKDAFSLKVWYEDGDSFEQTPVTIQSSWTAKPKRINLPKPKNTATPTPTVKLALGANTFTPTSTGTETFTPTVTETPTPCQTAAPSYDSVFYEVGDSYIGGEGALDATKAFARVAGETVKKWYPGSLPYLYPLPSTEPMSWSNSMTIHLTDVVREKRLPIGYMLFESGPACFFVVHDDYRDECCKGATAAEGVSYSFNYQKYMDESIRQIYDFNPDVNLVVMGIGDTSGGAGHYAPPEVYQAYRDRLFELQKKYPRMRIADIYTATKDHAEYFHHDHDNKDHPNDIGQAIVARCIIDQFAYWPYNPTRPWYTPTPEPTQTPTPVPVKTPLSGKASEPAKTPGH